jgi:hydrogenase nickel incorporation protein HypB
LVAVPHFGERPFKVEHVRERERRVKRHEVPNATLRDRVAHLDAALVHQAFEQLDCSDITLLAIENVGNLVCPAAFDLGESRRIAVLSVTDGEDKPLKYPALFKSADAVVINKTDLAEAVGFDRHSAIANLRAIAPQAELFELSARTGSGIDALISWLNDPTS